MGWFKLFKISCKTITGLDKPLEVIVEDTQQIINAATFEGHMALDNQKWFREAGKASLKARIKAEEKRRAAKRAAKKAKAEAEAAKAKAEAEAAKAKAEAEAAKAEAEAKKEKNNQNK